MRLGGSQLGSVRSRLGGFAAVLVETGGRNYIDRRVTPAYADGGSGSSVSRTATGANVTIDPSARREPGAPAYIER